MKSQLVNKRMKIVFSITFIVTILFLAQNVCAQSSCYCVNSHTEFNDAGVSKDWLGGNVYHYRDSVSIGEETGDIIANFQMIEDGNINLNTFKTHFDGKLTLSDVTVRGLGDMSGDFKGNYQGSGLYTPEPFTLSWDVEYVTHGSGDFKGMKLFQSCTGVNDGTGREDCEGFILDPHGTIPDVPCE